MIALDVKTTGPDPHHDQIVSITLGTPGKVYVLDMRPYYALPAEDQQCWRQALIILFNHSGITWVGHNLKFLAAHFGIQLSQAYDTMLVE